MDNYETVTPAEISVDIAVAAELFAQLSAAEQDAIIDLLKSLLSER